MGDVHGLATVMCRKPLQCRASKPWVRHTCEGCDRSLLLALGFDRLRDAVKIHARMCAAWFVGCPLLRPKVQVIIWWALVAHAYATLRSVRVVLAASALLDE